MKNFHHRLLLISIFFVVSTLAKDVPISSPGPSPTLQSVSFPDADPELSPTLAPSPSLIPVGVPLSPQAGSDGSPEASYGEVSLSPQSDAPESTAADVRIYSLGPSPTLMPVSSPNAEPELSPTSPLLPRPPSTGSEESPEGPDGDLPVSVQSEESPEGPDGDLPLSLQSEETPEGPDGELPISLQSDEPESNEAEPDEEESETEPDSEPQQETGDTKVEVKKVCESTDYPSLCLKTIGSLAESKNEVTLDTVLGASIKATNDLAKGAQVMAKKLANTPGTPDELSSVLRTCEESYDDAADNVQRAMEAFNTKDVGTMNTMLSAVITDVGDCNDQFTSLNIPSPVADFAEKLTNMTSNCLAITSLLKS